MRIWVVHILLLIKNEIDFEESDLIFSHYESHKTWHIKLVMYA